MDIKQKLSKLRIAGEFFHSDLVGYTTSGQLACMGFVGRRTGVERALVQLHKGQCIDIDGEPVSPLGEKAYRVSRHPLIHDRQRLMRAYVLPSTAVQTVQRGRSGYTNAALSGESEKGNKAKSMEQVLIWRTRQTQGSANGSNDSDTDNLALWNWLKARTSIPVLDAWADVILQRLRGVSAMSDQPDNTSTDADVDSGDSVSEETGADTSVPVLDNVRFDPAGDGRWCGVTIKISDRAMAAVVHDALTSGDITVPETTHRSH